MGCLTSRVGAIGCLLAHGRKRGWLCWLFLRRNEILQKSLGSVSNKFGLKVVSTEWAMIIHRFVVSVQFLFVFCMEWARGKSQYLKSTFSQPLDQWEALGNCPINFHQGLFALCSRLGIIQHYYTSFIEGNFSISERRLPLQNARRAKFTSLSDFKMFYRGERCHIFLPQPKTRGQLIMFVHQIGGLGWEQSHLSAKFLAVVPLGWIEVMRP